MQVGILIFPDVEELDFVGPFEVLSYVNKLRPGSVNVSIIAETDETIKAYNGLKVIPDYTFSTVPPLDILVIPGGKGRHQATVNKRLVSFVKNTATTAQIVCSVCTGAFVLAEAGLLNGKKATTHYSALDELEKRYPKISVVKAKIVDQDSVLSAAGVSSGLDLALTLVSKVFDPSLAQEVARRIEYKPCQVQF